MFATACFIDQQLLKESFFNQNWRVHSQYQNSFNLQNEEKKELVVITTTDYPFMPNGIYLDKSNFSKVIQKIGIGDPVSWEKGCLHFTNHYLIVSQAKGYSSESHSLKSIKKANLDYFISYVKSLAKETGFQLSLLQFFEESTLYRKSIQQVSSDEMKQQAVGLRFLLGRGKGLTPSGDDMLVGHLAVRLLLKEDSPSLRELLEQELASTEVRTTEVSKHYLLCGLTQRFSEPVKELLCVLTQNSNQEQVRTAVDAIVKIGHTSGVDLLAGFLVTVDYFRKNKGGSLWRIE